MNKKQIIARTYWLQSASLLLIVILVALSEAYGFDVIRATLIVANVALLIFQWRIREKWKRMR